MQQRNENPRWHKEPKNPPSRAQDAIYERTKKALEESGFFSVLNGPLSEVYKISRGVNSFVQHHHSSRQSPFPAIAMILDSLPFKEKPLILSKYFPEYNESVDLKSSGMLDLQFSRKNQETPETFTYNRVDRRKSSFRGFSLEGEWRRPNKLAVHLLDPSKQEHQPESQKEAKDAVNGLINGMFCESPQYLEYFRTNLYLDIPIETLFMGISLKLDNEGKDFQLTFLGDNAAQKTLYIREDGKFGIKSVAFGNGEGEKEYQFDGIPAVAIDLHYLGVFFRQAIASFQPLDIPEPLAPPVKEPSSLIIPNPTRWS